MTNPVGVDALQLDGATPTIRCVAALGCVRSGGIWLGVVKTEDAGPLLDSLIIVGWGKGAVSAAMIDLHLGIAACVTWIHVFNHLRCVSVFSS